MRVLLLGSMDNEKIPLALRKEHILYDHIADPEAEPPVLPDGVYDVIILFAGRMGKSVTEYLPQILASLREGGVSLPVLVLAAHLPAARIEHPVHESPGTDPADQSAHTGCPPG